MISGGERCGWGGIGTLVAVVAVCGVFLKRFAAGA